MLKKNSKKEISETNSPKEVLRIYQGYPELPYVSKERDIHSWLEQVALFNNIVPRGNMERLPEGVLPGHILLLWRINFNNFTNITTIPTYFEYQYGIDGSQEINNLIAKQMVIVLSATNSLKFLTVPQLKKMIEEKQLKPKKLKDDLIEQVRESYDDSTLENSLFVRGYEITEKGKKLLKKYQKIVNKHSNK